jgi:hypothetical protein
VPVVFKIAPPIRFDRWFVSRFYRPWAASECAVRLAAGPVAVTITHGTAEMMPPS